MYLQMTAKLQQLVIALSLGLLGGLFNFVKVPVIFGVAFLFGGSLALAPALLYGPGYGLMAAVIAGLPSLFGGQHPYILLIFGLEAFVVGWLVRRRRDAAIEAMLLFWLSLGAPIAFALYWGGVAPDIFRALLVSGTHAVNGMVNVIVCSLGVWLWGLESKMDSQASRTWSLRSHLTLTLTATVTLPILVGTIWFGHWVSDQIHKDAFEEAAKTGAVVQRHLGHWGTASSLYIDELLGLSALLIGVTLACIASAITVSAILGRIISGSLAKLTTTARLCQETGEIPPWLGADRIAEVDQLSVSMLDTMKQLHSSLQQHRQSEESLRIYSERLGAAVLATHTALWERNLPGEAISWVGNVERVFGVLADQLDTLPALLERVHPEDRGRVAEATLHLALSGDAFNIEFRVVWPDGSLHWIRGQVKAFMHENGAPTRVSGTVAEITEQRWNEAFLEGQRRILEMIATGAPLPEVMAGLVQFVEGQSGDALCSLWSLNEQEMRLNLVAAPSLPDGYIRTANALEVGSAASCGSSVMNRRPVITADIASDPLWDGLREAALAHGLRACWSIPVFSDTGVVSGIFAMYHRRVKRPSPSDERIIELAAYVAGIVLDRHRLENERSAMTLRRDEWVGQIVTAQEAERQRVARDLHDWMAQGLVGPSYRIQFARRVMRRALGEAEAELVQVLADMQAAGIELRKIMMNLRPYLLDELGIVETIRAYAASFTKQNGINCMLALDNGLNAEAQPYIGIVLFRIVQEVLNNVLRHAGASEVLIGLASEPNRVLLEIQDNGIGFTPSTAQVKLGGFGLIGMTERVKMVGGHLTVASAPGVGTLVRVEIPL